MKENYKIEFTDDEISKLTCFCLIFKKELITQAEAYERLTLNEFNDLDEKTIEKFKSNAEWHRKTYEVITRIVKKLDELPF